MKRWTTLLLTVALALPVGAPTAAAHAGPRPPATPACAWEPLGYRTSNVAYPDTNAQYWLLHYKVQDGLSIELDGRYPDARYLSYATYDSTRSSFTGADGTPSALTDHRIAPDRGGRNPYQRHTRPGGRYTVTVAENAGDRRNGLPIAPADTAAGAEGTVIYRLYLPNGKISLPRVTFVRGGHRVRVATCDDALAPTVESAGPAARPRVSAPAPAPGADPPPQPAFARSTGAGLYPNPDNAYLSTGFEAPPPGQVLVVRGRAPVATGGDHARPWPDRTAQVRYWSMCDNLWWGPGAVVANPLPDGTESLGCRADFDTELSENGTYTYVVGTEEQREAIEKVPGATFLPLSAATPTDKHLLILRNMVASAGFDQAIHRVPPGSGATATAEAMGPYYPRTAYCELNRIITAGPASCPVS
ncbi:hypothetical protein L1I79_24650 [Strepomyces sp. STD 3.1]|nr:hypothetical protein [Streptomyces sp. STD 3.1]